MYRQGDVLLVRLDPDDRRIRQARQRATRSHLYSVIDTTRMMNERVLARGEATGHMHVLRGRAVYYLDTGSDGYQVIQVLEPAVLKHENEKGERADHAPIDLAPDWYEFRRQREFTGVVGRPRRVSD
jgi:hypothetical protein